MRRALSRVSRVRVAAVAARSPRSVALPRHARALSGASLDFRRLRRKRSLAPKPEADADFYFMGQDRLGDELHLNWAVSMYGIQAAHDVYRNLHQRALVQHSSGSLDANKALHMNVTDTGKHTTFVVGLDREAGDAVVPLTDLQWGPLVRRLRKHLSTANIYVHDGSVGLDAATSVTVRTLCDTANAAFTLNNVAPTFALPYWAERDPAAVAEWEAQIPNLEELDDDAIEEQIDAGTLPPRPERIPVSKLTGFVINSLPYHGVEGLPTGGESFSVIDFKRGIVAAFNTQGTARLQQTWAAAATARLRPDTAVVTGQTLPASGGARTLVVSGGAPSQSFVSSARGGSVADAWRSSVHVVDPKSSDSHAPGTLVQHNAADKSITVTRPSGGAGALAAVVLDVSDASGVLPPVSTATAGQAAALLLASHTAASVASPVPHGADAIAAAKVLATTIEACGAPVYVVNTGVQSGVNVASVACAVSDGSIGSAKKRSVTHAFDASEVTGLAGVSAHKPASADKAKQLRALLDAAAAQVDVTL